MSHLDIGFLPEGLQQDCVDAEGDTGSQEDGQDHTRIAVTGRHSQDRQEGSGACGGHQPGVKQGVGDDTRHAAQDQADNGDGIHQHVREVDFVDPAQEFNDQGTGCGFPCAALSKQAVGQQQSQTRSGVGFNQEEDGLPGFRHLVHAHGCEHAVVDGVVQEQHLGGFHDHAGQPQQSVVHQEGDPGFQGTVERQAHRFDGQTAKNRQDGAENAGGEVREQHLETLRGARLDVGIHFLHAPSAEGTGNHGTDEHRRFGPGGDTRRGTGTYDGSPVPIHHFAPGIGNQDRQQKPLHGGDKGVQRFIRTPARGNEQCGDDSPGNEDGDIRHDHSRKEPAKGLQFLFHDSLLVLSVLILNVRKRFLQSNPVDVWHRLKCQGFRECGTVDNARLQARGSNGSFPVSAAGWKRTARDHRTSAKRGPRCIPSDVRKSPSLSVRQRILFYSARAASLRRCASTARSFL